MATNYDVTATAADMAPHRHARRLGKSILRELSSISGGPGLRLGVFHPATSLLPDFTLTSTRVALLRAAGMRIGRGTTVQGSVTFVGRPRNVSQIVIGAECIIAPQVKLGLEAPITIGDRVALGPGVTLCTATHGLGFGSRRMHLPTDVRPITIGDGAWICMYALVLPGVTVGAGAVVSAGSVVTEDVRPHTLVTGNPAVVAQELPFANR